MKNILYFILPAFFIVFNLNAQFVDKDGKAILDKASQIIQKSTGMKADFTLTIDNAQVAKKESIEGVIWLKGNKFKYTASDIETFFDGKTQWVYIKSSKEVSVSTPTKEELQDVNPTMILTSYQKGYKIKKEEDKKHNGVLVYDVSLYPEDREKDYFKINLLIDKQTYQILSIATSGKNGTTTIIKIKKYQDNLNLLDALFVFDSKKYPGVELIDLR